MTTHERAVSIQFGPQANAYVTSDVHARGKDLERLTELVRGRSTARVLDLGCGGGHVSFACAPHVAEVVAVDLSAEMLRAVTEYAATAGLTNIRTVQAAVESVHVPPGSFDVVVSRYSAHHWRELVPGLRAARRALRDGGLAVFIDVVAPGDPLCDTHLQTVELLRDRSHVRDRNVDEWETALVTSGFVVNEVIADRLLLQFDSWVARMRTPEIAQRAIRELWNGAPAEVREHFAVNADGDFTVDTAYLAAVAC